MKSGFGQICPVAVASEVFAQRWTPIILREMFAGSQHFNDIHRGVPLISRALLAQRLRSLEASGVIARECLPQSRGHCYCLTEAGREFHTLIEGLGAWDSAGPCGSSATTSIRVSLCGTCAGALRWIACRRAAL